MSTLSVGEIKEIACRMRVVILALSFCAVLACPAEVKALDCVVPAWVWSRQADGNEMSRGQQLREQEDRFSVYRLEQASVIFRGRVVSARYLSDIGKTNTPSSLLVFDRVEILKGRLFTASRDRRAFVISEEWCDASCLGKPSPKAMWPAGKMVVIAAHPNHFADPSKAVDFSDNHVVYRGRIDATLGMCDAGPLSDRAVEILNDPDEMARIKREAEARRAD